MIESSSTRLSPSVPAPVPVVAVTLYVVPLPVTLVIRGDPPSPPFTSAKSAAFTPITISLKVTFHGILFAPVGVDDARTINRTEGAVVSVTVTLFTLQPSLIELPCVIFCVGSTAQTPPPVRGFVRVPTTVGVVGIVIVTVPPTGIAMALAVRQSSVADAIEHESDPLVPPPTEKVGVP